MMVHGLFLSGLPTLAFLFDSPALLVPLAKMILKKMKEIDERWRNSIQVRPQARLSSVRHHSLFHVLFSCLAFCERR